MILSRHITILFCLLYPNALWPTRLRLPHTALNLHVCISKVSQTHYLPLYYAWTCVCSYAFIHEHNLLEEAQGALLFKVLWSFYALPLVCSWPIKSLSQMDVWLKQHPWDVYAALQNAVSFKTPWSDCPASPEKPRLRLHVWFGAEIQKLLWM